MAANDLKERYETVMGDALPSTDKCTVRLWDGMDGAWCDVDEATGVSVDEALKVWMDRTSNGTKAVSFQDIDYYKIFPADSRMEWDGSEGREMFR